MKHHRPKNPLLRDIENRVGMIFRKQAKKGYHNTTCKEVECKFPRCLCSSNQQ